MTAEEAADVLQAQQTIAAADLESDGQRAFEEEERRAGVIEAQPRCVRIEISTPDTLRLTPTRSESESRPSRIRRGRAVTTGHL